MFVIFLYLQDLLVNLIQEIKELKNQFQAFDSKINELQKSIKSCYKEEYPSTSTIKSEESENEKKLQRLAARDPYQFTLQGMDILFTKQEMATSLLFKSKSPKSTKPALDHKRVEELLQAVDMKFGVDSYNIKTLTAKANQKCRDSNEMKKEKKEKKSEEKDSVKEKTSAKE